MMNEPLSNPISKAYIVWVMTVITLTIIGCLVLANASVNKKATKTFIGSVQSVSWSKTVAIEEWQDGILEDWKERIPKDSEILSCNIKERVNYFNRSGKTHQVCQRVKVPAGRGISQFVEKCHVEFVEPPREYVSYCQYKGKKWEVVDSVSSTGNDLNIKMATLSLKENQRSGLSDSSFSVWFETSDGIKVFHTKNEYLFMQCQTGSKWILIDALSTLDQIDSIQPQPTPRR